MERRTIEKLFRRLEQQKRHRFPRPGERLDAPVDHGVYVIRDSAKRVVHVGRTLRGRRGLSQRLHNHLRGQSSFVRIYLGGKSKELGTGYTFQYLKVQDDRQRALLEYHATARYCPKHLGLGAQLANQKSR